MAADKAVSSRRCAEEFQHAAVALAALPAQLFDIDRLGPVALSVTEGAADQFVRGAVPGVVDGLVEHTRRTRASVKSVRSRGHGDPGRPPDAGV